MSEEFTAAEKRRLEKRVRAERVMGDNGHLFDHPVPAELLTPYSNGDNTELEQIRVQRKYINRANNIRRCWNRFQLYLPELMYPEEPQDIFEMSTAHGGMLEVARHFGHTVLGNDFPNMLNNKQTELASTHRRLNDETFVCETDNHGIQIPKDHKVHDWPYRPIIEAIDIPMTLFDAGRTPYPLADKSKDVLICMQSIEHYCHPQDWMLILDEFCRITRKTILIMLNPVIGHFANDPFYTECFEKARHDLHMYRRNGFRTTSCHIQWSQVLVFKITAV